MIEAEGGPSALASMTEEESDWSVVGSSTEVGDDDRVA